MTGYGDTSPHAIFGLMGKLFLQDRTFFSLTIFELVFTSGLVHSVRVADVLSIANTNSIFKGDQDG